MKLSETVVAKALIGWGEFLVEICTEFCSGRGVGLICLLNDVGNCRFVDDLGKNDIGDAAVRKRTVSRLALVLVMTSWSTRALFCCFSVCKKAISSSCDNKKRARYDLMLGSENFFSIFLSQAAYPN